MDRWLDIFFFVFHTGFIVFFLTGWLLARTRAWHRAAVVLTAFSWFGLGLWFGFGYCPCTDWHWRVRGRLGDHDLPYSYIKFLVDRLTGFDVPAGGVNVVTFAAFALTGLATAVVYARDRRAMARTAGAPHSAGVCLDPHDGAPEHDARET